jgi:predicted metal-dependent HD superfamily phosphohydrolase
MRQGFVIRDRETCENVMEIAALTGETHEQVVLTALRDRLTRVRLIGSRDTRLSAMLAVVPNELLADVRRRYDEPQRHYHGWSHIVSLLTHLADLCDRLHDRKAVAYAILYHDAIYDPTRNDNEERSCELVDAALRRPWQSALRDRVRRLILATKTHELAADMNTDEREDAAVFLDMDLSILGAEDSAFDAYDRDIRREYAHVPDAAYRQARAAILARFLAKQDLFLSDWGRAQFDERARSNLRRALERSS